MASRSAHTAPGGYSAMPGRSVKRGRTASLNRSLTLRSQCSLVEIGTGALAPGEGTMRFAIAVTAVAAVLLSTAAAQAEKRIFIIANDSDAYGVDVKEGVRAG